jgi:hypothetical protein
MLTEEKIEAISRANIIEEKCNSHLMVNIDEQTPNSSFILHLLRTSEIPALVCYDVDHGAMVLLSQLDRTRH